VPLQLRMTRPPCRPHRSGERPLSQLCVSSMCRSRRPPRASVARGPGSPTRIGSTIGMVAASLPADRHYVETAGVGHHLSPSLSANCPPATCLQLISPNAAAAPAPPAASKMSVCPSNFVPPVPRAALTVRVNPSVQRVAPVSVSFWQPAWVPSFFSAWWLASGASFFHLLSPAAPCAYFRLPSPAALACCHPRLLPPAVAYCFLRLLPHTVSWWPLSLLSPAVACCAVAARPAYCRLPSA
jgi:hypothetical protein